MIEIIEENNQIFLTLYILDQKITIPLLWLIVGSKTSIDIDIMVLLTPEIVALLDKKINVYLSLIEELDDILTPYIRKMAIINNNNLEDYMFYNKESLRNKFLKCTFQTSLEWVPKLINTTF